LRSVLPASTEAHPPRDRRLSSAMSLKERITQDMKLALRAREQDRLRAIRLLQAAIQRQEIDERATLEDAAVAATVQKLVKQSQDALEQFRKAGREDLAKREQDDIAVWQSYLPEQLSDPEIDKLIAEVLSETSASSMKDMGKVMAALKSKAQGRTDMGKLSARVKAKLGTG
jgi:uncharacterized protein YqeY